MPQKSKSKKKMHLIGQKQMVEKLTIIANTVGAHMNHKDAQLMAETI